MDSFIRFHLDEHIAPRIARALRTRGIDVTTAAETGLVGADDDIHLNFARVQNRVVVTRDADFLRLASQEIDHAGIISIRNPAASESSVIQYLILVHGVLTPDEIRGRVEYL